MATRKRRAENLSSHAGAGTAENQNDPNQNDAQSPLPVDPDEHLLPLPGSSRALVSLTGSRFERTLLWRLDWYNYLYVFFFFFCFFFHSIRLISSHPSSHLHVSNRTRKAITLATTGYRTDAIRLIGSQVMQPRGLTGLAQDTLDASGSELRCVFELLANESSYPVLLHCTQGKDRTGLIVLLALLLCGENVVPASAIADDYARSELELIPEFEERMREIRELGLDENYTRCPPGFILSTTDYLTEKYGGVSKYLAGIGVDECMQQCIRSRILA